MDNKYFPSRIASVILRVLQLISSAVVAGILGFFINRVRHVGRLNGRLTFTEVVAALSIAAAILLMWPGLHVFTMWPVDVILFILWLVAFALLINLAVTNVCHSSWYYNYWGFFWNRWWHTRGTRLTTHGCAEWRTILAFSCLAWLCFLASACIGLYVFLHRRKNRAARVDSDQLPTQRKRSFPWKQEKPEAHQNYGNMSTNGHVTTNGHMTTNGNTTTNDYTTTNRNMTANDPVTTNRNITTNDYTTTNRNMTANDPMTTNRNMAANDPLYSNRNITTNDPMTTNRHMNTNGNMTTNRNTTTTGQTV